MSRWVSWSWARHCPLAGSLPPGISLSASPGDDPKAQPEEGEQGLQTAGCIGHQRARFSSRAQVLSHCL